MNYWLIKSEPFKYSWEQFNKDGVTFWDGVRNYAARNNLKAMKKGDLLFWYHSKRRARNCWHSKAGKRSLSRPNNRSRCLGCGGCKASQKIKETCKSCTNKS